MSCLWKEEEKNSVVLRKERDKPDFQINGKMRSISLKEMHRKNGSALQKTALNEPRKERHLWYWEKGENSCHILQEEFDQKLLGSARKKKLGRQNRGGKKSVKLVRSRSVNTPQKGKVTKSPF